MFLLKRIALAAAMSCCSESAIAEAAAKNAAPAKSEAAPRQTAEVQPTAADVSIAVKPSP
jgi:hypothetical protein